MRPRFEDMEAKLDAEVEDHLGDSISYTRGGAAPVTIRGFLNLSSDEDAPDIDPGRQRWRATIAKSRLPGGPKPTDRITHRKLDGPYRPTVSTLAGDGRDWVFDIQRAP